MEDKSEIFDPYNPVHEKEDLKFFLRQNDRTVIIPSRASEDELRRMAHQQMLTSSPPVTPTSKTGRPLRQCTLNSNNQGPKNPSTRSGVPKTRDLATRSVSAPALPAHNSPPVKQKLQKLEAADGAYMTTANPNTTKAVVSKATAKRNNLTKPPVNAKNATDKKMQSDDLAWKSAENTKDAIVTKIHAKKNVKKPLATVLPKEPRSDDSVLESAGDGSSNMSLNTAEPQENLPTLFPSAANRVILPIPSTKPKAHGTPKKDEPQTISVTNIETPKVPEPANLKTVQIGVSQTDTESLILPKADVSLDDLANTLANFIAAGNGFLRSANDALAKLQEFKATDPETTSPDPAPSCTRMAQSQVEPGHSQRTMELVSIPVPPATSTFSDYVLIDLPLPAVHGETHIPERVGDFPTAFLRDIHIGLPGFPGALPRTFLELLREVAPWSTPRQPSRVAIKSLIQLDSTSFEAQNSLVSCDVIQHTTTCGTLIPHSFKGMYPPRIEFTFVFDLLASSPLILEPSWVASAIKIGALTSGVDSLVALLQKPSSLRPNPSRDEISSQDEISLVINYTGTSQAGAPQVQFDVFPTDQDTCPDSEFRTVPLHASNYYPSQFARSPGSQLTEFSTPTLQLLPTVVPPLARAAGFAASTSLEDALHEAMSG